MSEMVDVNEVTGLLFDAIGALEQVSNASSREVECFDALHRWFGATVASLKQAETLRIKQTETRLDAYSRLPWEV